MALGIIRNARNPSTTISSGGTKSSSIDIGAYAILGFQTPSALTGTSFTFEVSADGTTFVPLKDATGTTVSVTVAASGGYPFPDEASAWKFIKIVSGTAEGANRTILLSFKG